MLLCSLFFLFFLIEALHGLWPWTFRCLNIWANIPVCWEDSWGQGSFLNPREPLSSVVFAPVISMVACFLWCPGSVPLPQFIRDLFSSSSLLPGPKKAHYIIDAFLLYKDIFCWTSLISFLNDSNANKRRPHLYHTVKFTWECCHKTML